MKRVEKGLFSSAKKVVKGAMGKKFGRSSFCQDLIDTRRTVRIFRNATNSRIFFFYPFQLQSVI